MISIYTYIPNKHTSLEKYMSVTKSCDFCSVGSKCLNCPQLEIVGVSPTRNYCLIVDITTGEILCSVISIKLARELCEHAIKKYGHKTVSFLRYVGRSGKIIKVVNYIR